MSTLSLGVCTHMGWATVTAVRLEGGRPAAVRTFRLETGDPDDRASLEPYHRAGGYEGAKRVPAPPDPAKVVNAGLRKQRHHTDKRLRELLSTLKVWPQPPGCGALFVGRGRTASSLERILASHAQIHVAEGNAVRDAVRRAFARQHIPLLEVDRKSLFDQAASRLSLDENTLDRHLKSLQPDNGGPWRQEERHCALAAWLAAVAE